MKKRKPIRKKLTSGLVLCAACALIAASLSGCGNRTGSGSSVEPEEESLDAAYRDIDSGFGVSDNVYSYEYDYDISTNSVNSTSASSESTLSDLEGIEEGTSQKLIRTVSMNLETTEFDDLTFELEERAEEMGGYVQSLNESTSSGENGKRWANMTIRIPEERLDEFLDMVGDSANVTYIGESVEDVTLSYVDLETHIDELRLEQKTMENLLDDAETIEEVIAIQAQLTEIRYELESYESQLKVLENRVSYSTVYLYISEVERETPAAPATFGERVQTRFSESIYRLGRGLRNFAVGFLGYFPIIILVVVIVAAALLIVWGCIHRNRKLKGIPTRGMMRKQLKEAKKEEKPVLIEDKSEEAPGDGEEEQPAEAPGDGEEDQSAEAPGDGEEEQPPEEPAETPEEEARRKAEDEFNEKWYDPNGPYA